MGKHMKKIRDIDHIMYPCYKDYKREIQFLLLKPANYMYPKFLTKVMYIIYSPMRLNFKIVYAKCPMLLWKITLL
jgi:hypothetical protein